MTRSKDTEISKFQIEILLRIQKDPHITRKELSRLLNKHPKTIIYHLKKLISAGLVKEKDNKNYKSYSLTKEAEQWLKKDKSPIISKPITRLHFYQLKFDIIKDYEGNLLEIGWKKGRDPDKWNWPSYTHRIESQLGEIFIEKTPRSFLVTLPKIITSHPAEADRIKNRLAFAVSDYLKKELPGLKIGIFDKDKKIQTSFSRTHSHYGIPGDPLASACTRLGMTLRSDRLLIDNSPGKENLKDINGNIYVGETEAIDRKWSQQDCYSLFDRYHEMIDGNLSAGRIDTVEDVAVSTRQMAESFEKEQESQNEELESLKETQKQHETAIGKITAILDRIDNSMKQRDDAFANIQQQQETFQTALNRLAYAETALSERVISPLTALKEQIVCYDDVSSGIAQRAIQELTEGEKRELKRHIGKLYW
ncbi:winged helix-turn-helix transcriptional regulator [Candidatus Poribacteria bacterium]|nr:winged helix-turn-helix transcriptional regulator [Candidatus Poribacteria bacterium]